MSSTVHRRPALVAAALVAAGGAFWAPASPASAACAGASLTYDTTVERGSTLTITGIGFGDACHDTGIPPDAHGALGDPLTGITISIVQNGVERVVAEGNADDDYELVVDVTVPTDLEPGEATVRVTADGDAPTYVEAPSAPPSHPLAPPHGPR